MNFIINKEKSLKKWSEYVKLFENFGKKEIPEELIYITNIIRKDIVSNGNISFIKKYEFGSYIFQINIEYEKSNIINYSSEIDILSILINLINDNYVVQIPIKINDININYDKTLSIITHELRHLYDILNISENKYEIKDFYKKRNLYLFKDSKYEKFTFQIYLSLEHEMIARNNMIYPCFRWSGETDKNKIIEKYKKTYTYTSLKDLSNFNHLNFISKYKEEELIDFTNKFIEFVAEENNFCHNKQDLIIFYNNWETFFKEKSIEYIKYGFNEINKVYDDIITNKIYEKNNNLISYDGLNFNIAEKIFTIFKSII